MVSRSLRLEAFCKPILIIRSRREKNGSEGESDGEEEAGEEEEEEESEEEEENLKESVASASEEIVPPTADDIAAARSARKEEKKKAKAAAGAVNDEDADLPVNANRLPVKNMTISDISSTRESSRKERFVEGVHSS